MAFAYTENISEKKEIIDNNLVRKGCGFFCLIKNITFLQTVVSVVLYYPFHGAWSLEHAKWIFVWASHRLVVTVI